MSLRTQVICDGHGCNQKADIVVHLPSGWHKLETKRTVYQEKGENFTTHTLEHYCPRCVSKA